MPVHTLSDSSGLCLCFRPLVHIHAGDGVGDVVYTSPIGVLCEK